MPAFDIKELRREVDARKMSTSEQASANGAIQLIQPNLSHLHLNLTSKAGS